MSDANEPKVGYWQVGYFDDQEDPPNQVALRHIDQETGAQIDSFMDTETAIGLALELLTAARLADGHPAPFAETEPQR